MISAIAHMVDQTINPRPGRRREDPMTIRYTVERAYVPEGRTRDMLVYLREQGKATTRELSDVSGIGARQIAACLRPAVRAGAVRSCGVAAWEWCK